MTLPTTAEIADRYGTLRQRLDALGGPDVAVMAVTKGFEPIVAQRAIDAGCTMLGENYAQELEAKAATIGKLPPGVGWHFIGRLQRNKVRRIADVVSRWDSVDRFSAAAEIAKRAPGAAVLIQVNVSGEPGKGGCEPEETAALVAGAVGGGLRVEGLMTVGRTGDPEEARPGFRLLRRLCDELELAECSMGMTGDFEVAVAEGATVVRVGTGLFGARPSR
jgi:hypothetical protein